MQSLHRDIVRVLLEKGASVAGVTVDQIRSCFDISLDRSVALSEELSGRKRIASMGDDVFAAEDTEVIAERPSNKVWKGITEELVRSNM